MSAHDVAAELRRRLPGLPTVKLHKLLYYCQGHHVGAFGVPLFTESLSAFDMGPVVGQLWFRERRRLPAPPAAAELDEAALNTIGYVVSRYGALTGADLMHLTHAEAPWRDANLHRTPGQSVPITVDALREFFSSPAAHDDEPDATLDMAAVRAWLVGAEQRRVENPEVDSVEELIARLNAE